MDHACASALTEDFGLGWLTGERDRIQEAISSSAMTADEESSRPLQ
jgi:hypothetical protein